MNMKMIAVQSIVRGALGVACVLFVGCSGKTGDTGGETHWQRGWLAGCISDSGCSDGFTCIAQLCSVGCVTDTECEPLGGECLAVGTQRACAVADRLGCIGGASACSDALEGWFCSVGAPTGCQTNVEICQEGQWVAGTIDDCRETITKASLTSANEVYETIIGDNEVALDILFVVDNSSSMASEQRSIARAFDGFMQTLNARVDAHPRIAVTTVDATCEVNNTSVFSSAGSFNQHAVRAFPPTAQFTFRAECREDSDCTAAACETLGQCDSAGVWACRAATSEPCTLNPNGSINTTCRRRCEADDECRTALGDPGYVCQKPSANEGDWGCILPPPSADCPADLPPFVEGDDLALARCLMVVGVNQEKCLKYEEGLEASRMALDPMGPNADQVAAFLRPEAMLAVVYVSDEDDCSAAMSLTEDNFETCAFLTTTDVGGPLVPTDVYADFLRGLKPQGRVMTMAIVGQSEAVGEAAQTADYEAYAASKTGPKNCYHQTSLCGNTDNVADWGKRYADLVGAFGPDGHVENICGLGAESAAQFDNIALAIARNAKRICLPRTETRGLVVGLTRDGVPSILTPSDYAVIEGAIECASGVAVAPEQRLEAGDRVRVSYE